MQVSTIQQCGDGSPPRLRAQQKANEMIHLKQMTRSDFCLALVCVREVPTIERVCNNVPVGPSRRHMLDATSSWKSVRIEVLSRIAGSVACCLPVPVPTTTRKKVEGE